MKIDTILDSKLLQFHIRSQIVHLELKTNHTLAKSQEIRFLNKFQCFMVNKSQCPGIELKPVIVHKEIQPQLLIHVHVFFIDLNILFIEQHQE
jgi:hypothetical protein